MREQSAASAKGTKRGATRQLRPREGSKSRELYDLLMAHKGEAVAVEMSSLYQRHPSGYIAINQLRDFYGLDIRRVRKNVWLLAGEWFGPTYIDYVADRFNKLSKSA